MTSLSMGRRQRLASKERELVFASAVFNHDLLASVLVIKKSDERTCLIAGLKRLDPRAVWLFNSEFTRAIFIDHQIVRVQANDSVRTAPVFRNPWQSAVRKEDAGFVRFTVLPNCFDHTRCINAESIQSMRNPLHNRTTRIDGLQN